jgi:hypothetical protein
MAKAETELLQKILEELKAIRKCLENRDDDRDIDDMTDGGECGTDNGDDEEKEQDDEAEKADIDTN